MSTGIDKVALRAELVAALEHEHTTLVAAQKITSEGVTHPDARQDSNKDMRATEASYLARGQAERVATLQRDVARARAMPLRDFGEGDPIGLSAVVTLIDEETGRRRSVLVAPAGGGMTVAGNIHVVTTASPLGRALLGATLGKVIEFNRGGEIQELEITTLV